MRRALLLGLVLWLGTAGAAAADPVFTPIAIWVATSLPFVAAAVDTFVFFAVQAALYAGSTWAITKLTTPGQRAGGQERQASVLSIGLGEAPREALIGEAATGGQLVDAFNYGGTYGTDWEVLVIALADHRNHSLVGYYIGDSYSEFAGDGAQTGFGGQLEIYFHDGAPGQAADAGLIADSFGRWTAADKMAGTSYVVVKYKADDPKATNPIWSTGRPQFLWRVKGAFFYDPREDPSVDGGDPGGTHSWDDPSTWAWSDNPALARYRFARGFYAEDEIDTPSALMIGRGLSAEEAPPERVIAAANLCDELVTLKAGGTEKRYRASGVIRADEPFDRVEELFAAAMAGTIVQREGGIEVEPGAAKSAVATITDLDLLAGLPIRVESFVSDVDRVNTVTPRYIDAAQIWRETAAPVRRSTADLIADGGLREMTLSLSLVTSQTQAQRCGEIERRLARKERRASLMLGPRFSHLEEGDWLNWTSDRYFGGSTVTFRIEAHSEDQGLRTGLVLREIAASCYAWTAATDEATPGQAPVDEPGALDALELAGAAVEAFAILGDDDTTRPGIKASWTTPVDLAIHAVRIEVRRVGEVEVAHDRCDDPNAGEFLTDSGVPGPAELEARLIPISTEGRRVTPSAWLPVTTEAVDVTGAVDIPSPNLWRKQDYVVSGGASSIDPAFGVANWGLRFPTTAGASTVSGKIFGLKPGYRYSVALRTKLTTGAGTAQIRVGFRDAGGAEISDLADRIVTVSTTEERWSWDLLGSLDADFVNAKFVIFTNAGDVAAGKVVDVADIHVVVGGKAPAGFSPCPDDKEGLRLFGYTGALDATHNTVTRATSSPASPVDGDIWVDSSVTPAKEYHRVSGAWVLAATVGGAYGDNIYESAGGSAATLAAFKTALGIAASIAGQAAAATDGTIQAGATNNNVSFSASAPGSPTDGDLWADTTTNPLVWKIRISSAWQTVASLGGVMGSTLYETLGGALATLANFKTSLGTAALIAGQGAWATEGTLTPTIVNGRTQYLNSAGQLYDYRGVLFGYSIDGVAGRTVNPHTISVGQIARAAHSVYFPTAVGATAVSVPAVTHSGLANDTNYTDFYRPQYGDNFIPTSAVAYLYAASQDGYMYVGQARTPTSGGTYNPPPGYSGTFTGSYEYCVSADAFLASGLRAGDAGVGDPLTLMTPDGDRTRPGEVSTITLAEAACLTFATVGGAVLTLSESTPVMTRKGEGYMPYAVRASLCEPGMTVPVLTEAGELEWQAVASITPAGSRPVARISAAGVGIYAASDRPTGPRIFTHNTWQKP